MLSLTIASLEERLGYWESLPGKIEKCAIDAWNAKQSISMLEREIDERRYTLEFDVRTDRETYKNEAARDLAVKQAMAADEGVQKRIRDIADYEEIKMRAERSLWLLKDESTIIKHHIQASIAILSALSGTSTIRKIVLGETPVESMRSEK